MPELPDSVYLVKKLSLLLQNQRLTYVKVSEPVVVRMLLAGDFAGTLAGRTFLEVHRKGPFLLFALDEQRELVIHPMLAGRFKISSAAAGTGASSCLAVGLSSGSELHYLDDKKMGKIYLTAAGDHQHIPRFSNQGVDLLSEGFTLDYFREHVLRSRTQVRTLIMDQTVVSTIGNAYADEILFCAGIHPKTFCYQLDETSSARFPASNNAL